MEYEDWIKDGIALEDIYVHVLNDLTPVFVEFDTWVPIAELNSEEWDTEDEPTEDRIYMVQEGENVEEALNDIVRTVEKEQGENLEAV